MPKPIIWTDETDAIIFMGRATRQSWDEIASRLGISRGAAIERGKAIKAHGRMPPAPKPKADTRDEALPAGHPITWGAITDGTILDGAPYAYQEPALGHRKRRATQDGAQAIPREA